MKTTNKLKGLAGFLVLFVLVSCHVSKDIKVPEASLPEQYRNQAAADTSSSADIPWKTFFADASLQELIDSAIRRNYDLQIAIKNIASSGLLFKQVNWNYVPEVDLSVSGASSRPSDNSLNGISYSDFLHTSHLENYNAGLYLSWEVDIWGKIRKQKKEALDTYLQSAEAKKAIQTRIVSDVAEGFYNLLMLDAQLEIAKKNAALNDSTLRIIKLQYTSGQVTALAVEQASAQQLSAAQLVPQFEQNIEIQENALKILTGSLPGRIERKAKLDEMVIADRVAAGIPAELLSRRPDVRSAELAVSIANSKMGLARVNMYPSITITADGGLNSFKTSNWFMLPASLFGDVAAGLTGPLLQHKTLKTKYEVAKVEREKAVIQFRQSVLGAVGEVSDALIKIEKLKDQETIAAKRVDALHHAISNANQLFRNGLATYLEVITAQSNALQSELDLATIKTARMNAASDLYRSLGGGWR